MVDCASRRAEVDAVAVGIRGQEEDGVARRRIVYDLVLVGTHIVTLIGVQKEPLTGATTLGASIAGYVGLTVGVQIPW